MSIIKKTLSKLVKLVAPKSSKAVEIFIADLCPLFTDAEATDIAGALLGYLVSHNLAKSSCSFEEFKELPEVRDLNLYQSNLNWLEDAYNNFIIYMGQEQ